MTSLFWGLYLSVYLNVHEVIQKTLKLKQFFPPYTVVCVCVCLSCVSCVWGQLPDPSVVSLHVVCATCFICLVFHRHRFECVLWFFFFYVCFFLFIEPQSDSLQTMLSPPCAAAPPCVFLCVCVWHSRVCVDTVPDRALEGCWSFLKPQIGSHRSNPPSFLLTLSTRSLQTCMW